MSTQYLRGWKLVDEVDLVKNRTDGDGSSLRNLFALGFVSFFTDMSSEMVFSLLPTFLLGLPGSSRAVLGLIEGTAEALSYALRSISGVFSDKFGRRKLFVLVGYSVSNVVKPLFSLARTPLDIFAVRVSDRVGKAVRTSPRDALLSESVSEKRRGVGFGVHRALDQAGAIAGPVAASGVMLLLGLTVRDVFWLSLIPGTTALLIILFLVKETVGKPVREFRLFKGVEAVLKGDFSRLLVVVGIFSLGAFNFSFVLLNAREAGVPDPLIPLVYAVVNIAHTAVAIPAGLLSDRIGREKVLVLGYGIFLSTAMLILLFAATGFTAFLVAVFFGAYFGIVETVQRAMIPGYVNSDVRGTAYGLYYLVVGSAFFFSNALVGMFWEHWGSSLAAAYSVTVSFIAILSVLLFLKR